MATLISKPSTIVVQAPIGADTSFGTGTATGSLQGDRWSPGRDAAGQVNAASWALVPRGRWVTVAGTRFDGLDAAVKAAVPSWTGDQLAWDALTQSWSGFAIDLQGGRAWLMGGGHTDGRNNGIYRFDVFKMAWAVQELPSDRALWSKAYTSNYSATSYPESAAEAEAKAKAGTLRAINDSYYDEIPGDKKPTARHTYSTMVYVPDSDELAMVCRRLWRYSLPGKKWTYRRLIRDQPTEWMDGENGVGIYDEATGELLASASGSGSNYRSTGYRLATNQWTEWSAPWNRYGGVADVRHGRRVTAISPPEQSGPMYASPGKYWLYDLDSRSNAASGDFQYAGGLSRADFSKFSWYYDGASVAYIASLERYWLCTKKANSQMGFFEINPTTTPWTLSPLPFTGAVPIPSPLLKRRMVYWPGINAVTLTDRGNNEMVLYRL